MESPRKRQKTDNDNASSEQVAIAAKPAADDAQLQKEIEVGITEFVTPQNEGFSGILKKRYALSNMECMGVELIAVQQIYRLPGQ